MGNDAINKYLSENQIERELDAFNAAFYDLGLRWHWDADTYRRLLACDEENERIRAYLEQQQPHMLTAYDADFLVGVIAKAKARCMDTMAAYGSPEAGRINWAEFHGAEVGV